MKFSPYIMGIDLGTSNSALAVFKKGCSEIISVDGNKTLPSVIRVREGGAVVVGRTARSAIMVDPDNTVVSFKREMGSDWSKEFSTAPGKLYSSTDLSAEVLSKLVSAAQESDSIEWRGTPRYAVLCIPANFNEAQKLATRKAGELANLDVLSLLEEPVAAAIAYATDRESDQTILVYDLGGGTFDVSILKVTSKSGKANFDVLAKEGIPKLGGDDFDAKIMEAASQKLEEVSKVNILDTTKDQGISVRALREAQQKLKNAAEEAKQVLTEATSATIEIPDVIKDEAGKSYHLEMEITRDEFENLIRDLLLQSKEAVQRALDAAKLGIEDISRILLVGGSTRVPLVKQMIIEMFKKEPYSDIDPDTIVARGAAIYAAALGVPGEPGRTEPDDEPGISITVTNIVTHFLGIETAGGKFSTLIDKGIDIPADQSLKQEKQYATPRDNMSELTIRVYQSDRPVEFVSDEGAAYVAEFFLTGIPAKPRGQELISVTFEIDQQNILKVRATSSGSAGDLEIQRN